MPVSKSLRFDIFRRDSFTCQYCGSKPPDVILEIDHITPLSQGGEDDPANLITSCNSCNRGKSAKILQPADQPHDLDLDYLEAEQRLTELERYKEIKQRLDKALENTISNLQSFFGNYMKTKQIPDANKFRWLLYYHDPDEIEKAIVLADGQSVYSSPEEKWRYACGILKNWRRGIKL